MTRSSRLGLRLTPAEKEIIDRAATLCRMSTADFVRSTMLAASERAVRAHRVLALTGEGAAAFVEAITNPPEPNENLRRLARAMREGNTGDDDPILSLADDPFEDETLPADASTNLDRYLYEDGECG